MTTITKGMKLTRKIGTDYKAYEVVAVKNQKNISVRELGHRPSFNATEKSNQWELFSDASNPIIDLKYRNKGWNEEVVTDFGDDLIFKDDERWIIRFGIARHYFNYEF